MKRIGRRIIGGVLAVIMVSGILCTSVFARSSAYLDAYNVVMIPESNGAMSLNVAVEGVGRMTEIGATAIYIYESKDGRNFSQVKSYESSDYPEMIGSGTFYNEDIVTYQGKVGYYYFAVVYVYAANANGSDTRRCETFIKQAIA